jgi:hypothetical protein
MRPDEAEREARRRFGNVGYIKDLGRDIKGGGFIEILLRDGLRHGRVFHPGAAFYGAGGVGCGHCDLQPWYGKLAASLAPGENNTAARLLYRASISIRQKTAGAISSSSRNKGANADQPAHDGNNRARDGEEIVQCELRQIGFA